jgi:hypothetical protein
MEEVTLERGGVAALAGVAGVAAVRGRLERLARLARLEPLMERGGVAGVAQHVLGAEGGHVAGVDGGRADRLGRSSANPGVEFRG